MMALLRPALQEEGAVAATRPPARRTDLGAACVHGVRAGSAQRRVLAQARRRSAMSDAWLALTGDVGACCGHVTARMVLLLRRVV